ncbi:hypothetical protein QFW96_11765 [Saccharopolyspora sp. TS4A08]|uniref:DUF1109 domain-containing protein n=1 Tax=Saccharopolyspora ipomoeae TaxID=3042027 RepID=A0ABT6PMQ6_9PSEU|nr:hypothetical protein [Saccharopolyspora sp. TS4A08]MDI2029294.1 hypothetical protein [Saccharopolyspora sp. TS4A08]
MTTTTPRGRWALRAMATDLAEAYRSGSRGERACYRVAALLLVSGLVHLGVLLVTGGQWSGPLSWRKPATFGLSFGLTLATLTWVLSFVPMRPRSRSRLLAIFAAACAVEVAGITMQAWRRVPSHFIPPETATAADVVAAASAALGAVAIVGVITAVTATVLRRHADVPPSMRLALRVGFLSLMVALAIGVLMMARGTVLTRVQGDVAQAFAFTAGLKPAHAATMHGVLVLPALAWFLRYAERPERFRLTVVRLAASGYGAFAAVVVVVTLFGLDPAGAVPAVLEGAGVLALVAAGVVAVRAVAAPQPTWNMFQKWSGRG